MHSTDEPGTSLDEKLEARRQAAEAELRYQTLFEQSPDGILVIDTSGHFIQFNDSAHRMLGYTRKEFAALHISDINVDSREKIRACIERLLQDGKATFEARYKAKDGNILNVQVFSRVMVLSGKSVFHSIWQDVTERKRVERRLKESEERYRALFEGSPDAIFIADPETGIILDANPAAARLLGCGREKIVGLHQSELHPPDRDSFSRDAFARHYLETKQGGETRPVEHEIVRSDGSRVPVEILARILTIQGKPVLQGVFRDISARKQIEAELRKSEKFIMDILEAVDEGFIVIDRDYRIISANRAFLEQVKLSRGEVVGRHCYQISHRLHVPCHEVGEECAVKRTFETGESASALHVHRDKDRDAVYTEIKSFPLKDASGQVVSAIETINNTTEKKNLEDQLRHAQKMEAVGRLAGGIAHDFNNILTAIVGYGSLMKIRMSGDDPLRHDLQQMLDGAERAVSVTRSLLAFSRKQPIHARPVTVNQIVANIEKLVRRLLDEDIEMKLALSGEDRTIMADSGQIEQVLMNLAVNANDAMTGSGTLTISTGRAVLDHEFIRARGCGQQGLYAFIAVSDTGAGMDQKTRERIYEPFYTTKDVGKGTGLGLSIVYGIVKQHNGFITCDSEPGKGTTFRIYFPAIGQKAGTGGAGTALSLPTGTETILIAEDDPMVAALMQDVLRQFGYSVITAADGADAIEKFRENRDRIHLLILDVMMPGKHGKEVFQAVNKIRPGIKAIFASGYDAGLLHTKGILEKEINFISKPVSPEDLLGIVRKTLDQA